MVETSKLNTKFSALGMNQLFAEQAGRLNLYTPADMMSANLALLKSNPEFTYTWYAEMLELLEKLELLREFQKNQL
ncbi:hypothetical protein [Mucilaginibacter endophyticus]|uniref:hypothetical protein n=1 Tax=Mucilaginibacter endophyticus TaxID=2675003 RepID=UPI000E0CF39E|nr:hypothetical protein [Mucilaginibacter endophyticus]